MARLFSRRPVWQPNFLSRCVRFLRSALAWALSRLTFVRVVLAVFALPLLFYVCREVKRDVLVIDPFSVPKSFEESGLTPDVVANRIGDAMRRMEGEVVTRVKKDNLVSQREEGSIPDVELPGTKLGLKTLVETVRTVRGIYPKHVSGDIVLRNQGANAGQPQCVATVYITQGRNRSQAFQVETTCNEIDSLARDTAEMILRRVNPYVLASYRYARHEPEKTAEILHEILRQGSQDRRLLAAANSFLGVLAEGQNKENEAVAQYKKAIELDPTFAVPYNNWGGVLFDQKNYDEALDKYKTAVKLDPTDPLTYTNWGELLVAQKKYDDAVAKYKKAIELDPNYAFSYASWGNMLGSQQKYDEALAKFQKAIELDPKDPIAYNGWGSVLLNQQKRYDDAIAKYRKAIELDPTFAMPYNNWGYALLLQNKYEDAIAKFQKAIELDPELERAYRNWGNALLAQKKDRAAEEKFAKARELATITASH